MEVYRVYPEDTKIGNKQEKKRNCFKEDGNVHVMKSFNLAPK